MADIDLTCDICWDPLGTNGGVIALECGETKVVWPRLCVILQFLVVVCACKRNWQAHELLGLFAEEH